MVNIDEVRRAVDRIKSYREMDQIVIYPEYHKDLETLIEFADELTEEAPPELQKFVDVLCHW